MKPPSVLLLSCYELGHQPLGLALPLAFFSNAGLDARGIDLAVDPLDEEAVRSADFIGISVPMHTALRIALDLLPRLRALNPRAHLCFYGLYAALNAELLLASGASSVLSGELEEDLISLARGAEPGSRAPILKRLSFPTPARSALAPLNRYARLELGDGTSRKVGAVETTRGCLHLCRHCPIPPIYQGRFFVIPQETVLADVRQMVEAGASHVDFADPDFLNGPGHALSVARAIHGEFPWLTFNFTAKIEHLVRHRRHLGELSELGCLFVVSAVESLSGRVLRELDKGHDRNAVFEATGALREAGIALRPTFVPFTPWTTRDDYADLFHWIAQDGLVEHVDAVQLTLRL
ncbi:MAG TPA: CUAEP/CCAEP-tail radical SAM protein, partial [Vicinamibacteria bacterium]|nr:CUAEP/CCAEP-tail radical SAM protein [Vicinamibacteria bacterium]